MTNRCRRSLPCGPARAIHQAILCGRICVRARVKRKECDSGASREFGSGDTFVRTWPLEPPATDCGLGGAAIRIPLTQFSAEVGNRACVPADKANPIDVKECDAIQEIRSSRANRDCTSAGPQTRPRTGELWPDNLCEPRRPRGGLWRGDVENGQLLARLKAVVWIRR